ncbi:hypothetical protein ACQK5W_05335 [Pantoea sp. FN060301]|uniref:hypothetical protein n=1 Tax=Pantoea sp. FN060301 TaxID=3420380 RepID=UPI003D1817A2
MAWQGIPFPLSEALLSATILNVGKIPKVVVDSGFGWDSVVGSFIAGLIPAFIAWYSIKKNISALEKDRENQQSSFDKDRNAQLDIAAKNLNAQVLSGNRQQWINSLRDTSAEYLAAVHQLRKSRTIARHCAHISKKSNGDFFIEHRDAIEAMTSDARIVDNLTFKIRLLINPSESEGARITELLKGINDCTGSFQEKPDRIKITAYGEELVLVMQKYLKQEWDRVKKIV